MTELVQALISLQICTTCSVTHGHNLKLLVMALTGWLFPLLFCSASFRITISLAMVTAQEPYARHFPLSCFSQHHPQTFLCSYLSLLLFISAYSLGCVLLFSLIFLLLGCGILLSLFHWPSKPAPGALSQTSSLFPSCSEQTNSAGWIILRVRCFVNFSHKQICCFPGSQLDAVFLDHSC